MNTQWIIQTRGDPLGTIRRFVGDLWQQAALDGMLVTANGGSEAGLARPLLIDDPAQLEGFNPFRPVMTINAARLVPELVKHNPQARLGGVLRPCEMRALNEMAKHNGFKLDNFTSISIDCLGTVPADEYRWRAARKGTTGGGLAQESLQFARQGGILGYRYRSACQVCASPAAGEAEVNINILGLPVRQLILVQARSQEIAERLRLQNLSDGAASPEIIEQHAHILARIKERHQNTMRRVENGLGDSLPQDLDALIARLEGCGDCQVCVNVCPICTIDAPQRDEHGHYRRGDVLRWMISCAGCGMCEQACKDRLPLSVIFGHIRSILADEFGYTPGRSASEPLPFA